MSMMFFHFLKIIFEISTSKRFKKYKPHSILAKKKKLKFSQTQVQPQSQTGSNRSCQDPASTRKVPSDRICPLFGFIDFQQELINFVIDY
jgi:hypothetical protein